MIGCAPWGLGLRGQRDVYRKSRMTLIGGISECHFAYSPVCTLLPTSIKFVSGMSDEVTVAQAACSCLGWNPM